MNSDLSILGFEFLPSTEDMVTTPCPLSPLVAWSLLPKHLMHGDLSLTSIIICQNFTHNKHLLVQLTDRVQRIHKEVAAEGAAKLEATYLARKLHYPGYVFKTRTALGGSCAGSCLRQLRHLFLTCSSKGELDPGTHQCGI